MRRKTTTVPAAAAAAMTTLGSTTIDHLCDSLLTEILLRLPLASAKRCQAVCKRWYALISEPTTNFISRFDRQLRENKGNFAFLFHCDLRLLVASPSDEPCFYSDGFSLDSSSSSSPKLPSPLLGCSASVVASCHDLLLFCSRDDKYAYYIYNPLTLSCTKLPLPPPSTTIVVLDVGLVCAFDNYDYYSAAATRDCKYAVLRIVRLAAGGGAIKVQIFSSDTAEWRENVVSCDPRRSLPNFYNHNGVPYNGLLFWLTRANRLIGLDPYNGGQFRRRIDLPAEFLPFRDGLVDGGFGVCNGKLRLFCISKDPILNISFIRIWDLKGYEEEEEVEWVLEKQVYFHGMVSKDSGWLTEAANTPDFSPRVLGCEPDDGDVLHIIIKHKDVLKVVMCNTHLQTLEESTLQAGAVPQSPQFRPPSTTQPPANTATVSVNKSLNGGPSPPLKHTIVKEATTAVNSEVTMSDQPKTENLVVPSAVKQAEALDKSSSNGVAGDPLGDARSKVQDEICEEFAAIMTTGTLSASEAAALATRRVMQRYGHLNAAA